MLNKRLQMMTDCCSKNVLLVDDETCLLRMLERLLNDAGYQVSAADNGREGLRLFHEAPSWDAVIVDRAMPEMNGEDMTAAIKATVPDMPVILITGFCDAVKRPQVFDAILAKPFRPSELIDCLSQTLQKRVLTLAAQGAAN